MHAKTVVIHDPVGLHARPASALVKAANRFHCSITVFVGDKHADAKSILQVLALQARQGMEARLEADGDDEAEAVEALGHLISDGHAEPQG